MNTRNELLFDAMLKFLADCSDPQSEPMIQASVQTSLVTTMTVNELDALLQFANRNFLAIGLPGANGKLRWSISDRGRHYLMNRARN